jgi:hypothetical protein
VSWDIHVDPKASMLKLTVRAATIRESPRVTEMVQHVSEQGRKLGTVQPIATVPSVGSEGGVGVVVHLSKKHKYTLIRPTAQEL